MASHLVRTYFKGAAFTLVIVATYWLGSEDAQPGQQFANPIWPCLFIASLGGQVAMSMSLADEIVHKLRYRRRTAKTT